MEVIVYPFLVSIMLFYMYETDFFVQYAKTFWLGKLFKIKEYEEHLNRSPEDTYWEWLVWDKQTFLRKLISCPYCLGFWLNVGAYFIYKDVGLLIINLWLSLFLFLVLKIMIRRAYEG